jgi:4-methyl-5(b-hydroxyethyl)-thiazole monophosphate biosynthesis
MARACVVLAEGFEEIEAVTVIDVLRRAEVYVELVAASAQNVQGAHGLDFYASMGVEEALENQWDAVICPGGLPGSHNLQSTPLVLQLLRTQKARGGIIAAICAAPIVLAEAKVLAGVRVTCYPGFEDQLGKVSYCEDDVVDDNDVITSRGVGTALKFALKLVERICSPEKAKELAEQMLVPL